MNPPTLLALGLTATLLAQPEVVASLDGSKAGAVKILQAVDLDGDQRAELIGIDAQGRVTAWRLDGDALRERASLTLPQPQYCLVAFADVDGRAGQELLTLGGDGCKAYALGGEGFAAPRDLLPRVRLRLRTLEPSLSSFARDLNGDGRIDLVVPGQTQSELWVRAPGDELVFTRALQLPTAAAIAHGNTGEGLQSTFTSSITLPALDAIDLDGDGRLDLRSRANQRFSYRMQQADASFGDLREVDLSLFRDTTPRADLQLGATATVSDDTLMNSRDLDLDGRPDYVLAHRRKLWVFLADAQGPQFKTAQDIKAVAEDITVPLPIDLDADGRPDLLLVRLQIPSPAAIALGLVRSLDVDVHALGYRNELTGKSGTGAPRVFAATPAWRRTVTLRVPPLLSLIERQDELATRFFAIVDQARHVARGEVDGQAPADLVRVGADGTALELWRGVGSNESARTRGRAEQRVAELLFQEADTVFDVDRILRVLDSYVAGTLAAGSDAKPDVTLPLRSKEQFELADLSLADLDGDGKAEAVLSYRAFGQGQARTVDVVKLGR